MIPKQNQNHKMAILFLNKKQIIPSHATSIIHKFGINTKDEMRITYDL